MDQPHYVSFSVDASHIDRLGRELVARQDTALAELIKNAYDADATQLLVTFHPETADRAPRIEIEDNGNGMTRDEIIRGFMRISTPEKVDNPHSPRFNRIRAGRKGIGRFAAQRLARRLTVITRSRLTDNEPAHRLELDWDDYVAKRDIQDVSVPITVETGASFGTRLILDDLRDFWTDDEVEQVTDSLAPLIQPPNENSASRDDSRSFSFAFVGPAGKTYTPDDAFLSLSRQAVATIHASVDENGIPVVTVTSDRIPEANGAIKLNDEAKGALRNVSLRAYYFIQNKEWLPAPVDARRTVREALRRYGGIRVYRNGFRIMPYGEPSDDWAQLDAEYRKRGALLAPIGNQNFIGLVEISDPEGHLFQETSSREGLIENAAFRELRQFVFGACYEAVRKISEGRAEQSSRIEKTATAGINTQVSRFAAALQRFESAASDSDKTEAGRVLLTLARGIAESTAVLQRTRIDEINMLRVLSTLGMTVAEFVHEVRGTITYATGDLADLFEASFQEPTKSRLSRLKTNLAVLSRYTDYFSAVITSNESLSVAAAITAPKGIELDVRVEGYGVNSRPMHEAEWFSILSNFLSNSVKALGPIAAGERKIQVRALKTESDVVIRFLDNGIGIPHENRTRIFDAFFTTTRTDLPRSRGNADAPTGMGLGLKIVRDIVESNDGTVSVVDAPAGFQTCLEVRLPGAWKSE
jgi:signal transduction histidine kinase